VNKPREQKVNTHMRTNREQTMNKLKEQTMNKPRTNREHT